LLIVPLLANAEQLVFSNDREAVICRVESFDNDNDANQWLKREMREPWELQQAS